jgi:hypothetical protein
LDKIIDDDSTYKLLYDPWDGALFEENKEGKLKWNEKIWYNIELETVAFGENTMYDPNPDNKDQMRDSRAMNALRKAGVPFLHVMPGLGYRVDELGDNLFIPAKHKELAQNILKRLKS